MRPAAVIRKCLRSLSLLKREKLVAAVGRDEPHGFNPETAPRKRNGSISLRPPAPGLNRFSQKKAGITQD